MKNLILISAVLIPTLFACGGGKHHKEGKERKECEEIKVPASVETTFKSLYPKVDEIEWNKEKSEYEAEFEFNEKEMSASFDSIGNLIETEEEIAITALPASITEQLKEAIASGNIKEASKMTDAKGVITYEAEFKKDLVFNSDGKCLNESEENDNEEVPEVVETAFKSNFKDAENVKWGKEDENFEAEFEMNDIDMSANFDNKGILLETESTINAKELPAAINTYVKKNLSGATIKEAAKIIDSKGKVTFEAEIDGADYIFDAKGNFIKKIEE